MPSPRLFVALDTPAVVRSALEGVIAELRSSGADVRWEHPAKLHVTLKFLGDTPDERIPEIAAVLRSIAQEHPPLQVRYRELGFFPGHRNPRIVWAGMHDSAGTVGLLQASIDAALAGLGYEREERPFHPHVTIGRVRGARRLESLLARTESITFDSPPMTLHEVLLVRSDLSAAGSTYSTLHTFPLLGKSLSGE